MVECAQLVCPKLGDCCTDNYFYACGQDEFLVCGHIRCFEEITDTRQVFALAILKIHIFLGTVYTFLQFSWVLVYLIHYNCNSQLLFLSDTYYTLIGAVKQKNEKYKYSLINEHVSHSIEFDLLRF